MSLYADLQFLVVDDMMTMRKVVIQQLKALGVTKTTEAADGVLAKAELEKAATEGRPFTFIVSDWNMPNMTGLELLKWCRSNEHYKNVAFLLVTAEAEVSQVSEAISSGVDNYVVKPFTPTSFQEKMQSVYLKRFSAKK